MEPAMRGDGATDAAKLRGWRATAGRWQCTTAYRAISTLSSFPALVFKSLLYCVSSFATSGPNLSNVLSPSSSLLSTPPPPPVASGATSSKSGTSSPFSESVNSEVCVQRSVPKKEKFILEIQWGLYAVPSYAVPSTQLVAEATYWAGAGRSFPGLLKQPAVVVVGWCETHRTVV